MSRTLDMLERVVHGTPAGYTAGCRSKGGCPNAGARGQLSCVEAARAHRHYFTLAQLDASTVITRAMRRRARDLPFAPTQK
ncbi:MAG: hypothetical protein ACTH07_05470 [Microbacterium sp.]